MIKHDAAEELGSVCAMRMQDGVSYLIDIAKTAPSEIHSFESLISASRSHWCWRSALKPRLNWIGGWNETFDRTGERVSYWLLSRT
jgi:hypothetical protein